MVSKGDTVIAQNNLQMKRSGSVREFVVGVLSNLPI